MVLAVLLPAPDGMEAAVKPRKRRCVRIEVVYCGKLIEKWTPIREGPWRWMNSAGDMFFSTKAVIGAAQDAYPGCAISKIYEEAT